MPIYEYRCEKCGEEFECLVLGSTKPECTACNSRNVTKMMSACGFVSKSAAGETASRSAGTSGCSGCAAASCSGCGHG